MIHEITSNVLDFIRKEGSNYLLTFDDGLFSQYYYLNELKKINTKKIFFVSTGLVHDLSKSSQLLNIDCRTAHKNFFENGDTSPYMTKDQIKEIMKTKDCEVGGHSHLHPRFKNLSSLKEKIDALTKDTDLMMEWFLDELNFIPKKYCLPYNFDYHGLLSSLLKEKYNLEVFGRGRIKVEEIINITD